MKSSVDNILNILFHPKSYFLLEVAAIPFYIRYEYLNKILSRKESNNQKNVQILKTIYECIDKNSPENWNEQEVIRKLGVSQRMLDCHKSRLLKGLREYYFNGNEIELEVRKNYSSDGELRIQFEIAKRQVKAGMFREAKNILIALEKVKSLKNFSADIIIDIYDLLLSYYFSIRDLRKYNLYAAKFLKFFSGKVRSKLSKDELQKLEVRLLYIKYTRLQFSSLTIHRNSKVKEYLENILKLINKDKDSRMYLKVLHIYGYHGKNIGSLNESVRICVKGLKFAIRKNLTDEYYNLKASLAVLRFLEDTGNSDEAYYEIEQIYNLAKESKINFNILLFIQSLYLRMLIYKNKDTDEATENFIFNLILFSKRAEAATRWYLELSDRYSSLIYIWKVKQFPNGKISFNIERDNEILKNFESINYKSLIHFNQTNTPEMLVVVYLNQIELEFWKGINCNFDNANYFIKKTERLLRTKLVRTNKIWLLSSKIGIKIFEDMKYMSIDKVYEKNINSIIDLISALKSKDYVYNISGELGKLIFIDSVVCHKKLTRHIMDFQDWLWIHKPELMSSIMSSINISTDVA